MLIGIWYCTTGSQPVLYFSLEQPHHTGTYDWRCIHSTFKPPGFDMKALIPFARQPHFLLRV